jgi:hypothetical protein
VLAGRGKGKDPRPADDADQARLRRQALELLNADLVLSKRQIESKKPEAIAEARSKLAVSKSEPELAGVRDPEALTRLPDGEPKAGRSLWNKVGALEQKATASTR